jgi:YVTN family beta-propeller protein
MKNLSRIAVCTLVVLLYLAGCGLLSPGPVPIYQTTSAQMAVALPGVVSPMGLSAGSAADVVSMAVVVAGEDIYGEYQDPLVTGELTLEGDGVWRVAIADLPIGPSLTFTVRGYDAADEEIFSGVTVQPLTGAGDTVSVDLEPIADAVLITFPVITQISRAAEIENGSLGNPVSVDVRGSADEPLSYSFTSGGGSFMPESGTVDLPSSGVGAFVSGYDAPAEIGEYYHGVRVTNSQGNAVTTDFLTMVVYGTTPVTMEMSFAPSVIGLSAQRIGIGVRWEAVVSDDGPEAELTYLWEYDGGLGFIDPTDNPAELSGYEETATGTITLTVTDGSGAGLSTTVSFLLAAGQFPDTLVVADSKPIYVYVANYISNDVSGYTINTGTGVLTSVGAAVAAGTTPYSIAVDHTGMFVYVANLDSNDVSGYTINPSTGVLTSVGAPVTAGTEPFSVAVDPTGTFVYVANFSSSDVSGYTINTGTGVLTSVGPPVAAGTFPGPVAVDPTGEFVYVANQGSNDVSGYTINTGTGVLTSVGPPVAAGTDPISLAVDPTGEFVYVANRGSNDVSGYTINTGTGVLTSIGAAVAAGTDPWSVAVDPTGKFVYVANGSSNDVSGYTINTGTGVLTLVGPTVAAGTTPDSIAVDPTGKFVYVANANSNDVSGYTINTGTGVLTSVGTTVAVGAGPISVATTRLMGTEY